MKVIYDSQIFSAQEYGGISRYFCELAKSVAAHGGVAVQIVAPMYINAYIDNGDKRLLSGFACPDLMRSNQSRFVKFLRRTLGLMLGGLVMRFQGPDIIHETYYSPLKFGSTSAKRVLTVFDMIHEKFSDQFPSSDKTAMYKSIAAKRADHVICISESTRRDVIDLLKLDPTKVSVTYLGFSKLSVASPSLKKIDGIDKPYILFVGNRSGYKNFKALLNAYSGSVLLRNNFKLVCFGGGPFTESERLEIVGFDLKNDAVLHFYGDDQRLSNFYTQATAFIYPSLYEGFGIPPLEAMANDCPVICSNTSSIPEVVGNAGEYFDPKDIHSLRNAIERVISSQSRMDELRSYGRERLNCFSWDICASETVSIYKKLV